MAVIETVLRFRYIMNYKVIPTFLSHRILPCALLWLLQLPALIVGPCLPRYHLLNCFSRRFSFSMIWSSALFEVLTDASTVWCCVLTFCCCLFFFSIAERGSDLHMAGLAKPHGVSIQSSSLMLSKCCLVNLEHLKWTHLGRNVACKI